MKNSSHWLCKEDFGKSSFLPEVLVICQNKTTKTSEKLIVMLNFQNKDHVILNGVTVASYAWVVGISFISLSVFSGMCFLHLCFNCFCFNCSNHTIFSENKSSIWVFIWTAFQHYSEKKNDSRFPTCMTEAKSSCLSSHLSCSLVKLGLKNLTYPRVKTADSFKSTSLSQMGWLALFHSPSG